MTLTDNASIAVCERGFSAINMQKNLGHKTLDNIMRIIVDGCSVSEFDPHPFCESWLHNSQGVRHIHSWKKKPKPELTNIRC